MIGIRIVQCGPIPEHVSFVMDGNRRWAKVRNLDRAQGHVNGFHKLGDTLTWCKKVGVRTVTVFAFAIDNFKRSKSEVDCLMDLARDKFEDMLNEPSWVDENKMVVRVLGRLDLLPQHVRDLAIRVMQYSEKRYGAQSEYMTKQQQSHRQPLVLNMCFAYSSSDEITQAITDHMLMMDHDDVASHVNNIVRDEDNGESTDDEKAQKTTVDSKALPTDHHHNHHNMGNHNHGSNMDVAAKPVSVESMSKHMRTRLSGNPDLVIRTSGEIRLSDFLTWQCTNDSMLYFTEAMWPDFSLWNFLAILLRYQMGNDDLEKYRASLASIDRKTSKSSVVAGVNSTTTH